VLAGLEISLPAVGGYFSAIALRLAATGHLVKLPDAPGMPASEPSRQFSRLMIQTVRPVSYWLLTAFLPELLCVHTLGPRPLHCTPMCIGWSMHTILTRKLGMGSTRLIHPSSFQMPSRLSRGQRSVRVKFSPHFSSLGQKYIHITPSNFHFGVKTS
jgi:hypothetical protein